MKVSNRIFNNPDVGGYYHRAAARYLDDAATTLPSSQPLMADGKALAEDDRVLFTALSNAAMNNRMYKVVKSAGALSLVLARDGKNPNGDSSDGDTVLIKDGSHLGELWTYEGSWIELDVDVAAADDYTPSNPPPGGSGLPDSEIDILALGDFPTSDTLDVSAVDDYKVININQTTPYVDQIVTLPDPTDAASCRSLFITNIGTAEFDLADEHGGLGDNLSSGTGTLVYWNGTKWYAVH